MASTHPLTQEEFEVMCDIFKRRFDAVMYYVAPRTDDPLKQRSILAFKKGSPTGTPLGYLEFPVND